MSKKTRAVNSAIALTAAPVKYRGEDDSCVGRILQNRDVANSIYVSSSNGIAQSFLELFPGSSVMEDILPGNGELWAYSSVAGTVLTMVDKYERE